MNTIPANEIPLVQRLVAVFWPSFITAGIATILLTSIFDPDVIFIDYDVSRLGVYSMTFFLFWLFGAVTALSTCFFLRPCATIRNQKDD